MCRLAVEFRCLLLRRRSGAAPEAAAQESRKPFRSTQTSKLNNRKRTPSRTVHHMTGPVAKV
jgi:hypothetical protein